MARRPSVCDASATDVAVGATRRKNSAMRSTRMRSRVINAFDCPRRTSIRMTFMLTGLTSCSTGTTKAPPLITTRSPPKPVRTKAVSFVDRR